MKVNWDESVCQHAGICVTQYPSLYQVKDGQFVITIENESEERVRESVERCPSGALTIEN